MLDSPLNKSGHLQVISTDLFALIGLRSYNQKRSHRNQLAHPYSSYIQSFCRSNGFAFLPFFTVVQLLHKEKVRNTDGDEILMKVLQGSVPSIIPVDSRRFATSITGRSVDPIEFAQVLSNWDDASVHSDTIVLSFGCFADGHSIPNYAEETISVSNFPVNKVMGVDV